MSIYGLQMAARTLTYLTRKSAILQHNLANQTTDGFKLDYAFGMTDASGVPNLARALNLGQGSFIQTGNTLDVALDGKGFFVVQGDQGPRLTRNGSFHLDPESKTLVDSAGRTVLGVDGPIMIAGNQVDIASNGNVEVDGKVVGRLRIANVVDAAAMEKEGAHLFVPNGPLIDTDATTTVRQFELEESNVNGISGIGDLIEIQRSFAMMSGAMQSLDDVLETVTGSVGRV